MNLFLVLLLIKILFALLTETICDEEELLKYFHNAEAKIKPQNFKTTSQRISEHNYHVETHNITTEDGYILTVFRMPYSHKLQNQFKKRPIVILQHGLFGSSDSWLLLGPNDGLAFMLVDAGFDVWLGNSRGNVYGRKHQNLSTYSMEFWQFSWHEIGYYDLPAIIDYALRENNPIENSIHYIGFSQGTTALLVMLTTRPAYNDKIKMAHLLAPVAFTRHSNDKMISTLAPLLGQPSLSAATIFIDQEFFPQNKLFLKLAYNICINPAIIMSGLCSAMSYLMEGNQTKLNTTALKHLMESHPAGCSTNQIIHYMQQKQNNRFCQFDFGISENKIIYGQEQPPDYKLDDIRSLLHLWYGDSDKLATFKDVERLALRISNKIMHHIEDPEWSHGDFKLNKRIKNFLHTPLIKILKNFEEEQKTF